MVDGIVFIVGIISGLRHAGDEHTCSLPDSATYSTPDTPRPSNSKVFRILAGQIDCFIQEDGLIVAKALGHLKAIAARCPLGEGGRGGDQRIGPLVCGPKA